MYLILMDSNETDMLSEILDHASDESRFLIWVWCHGGVITDPFYRVARDLLKIMLNPNPLNYLIKPTWN